MGRRGRASKNAVGVKDGPVEKGQGQSTPRAFQENQRSQKAYAEWITCNCESTPPES
jgi:hypothetical protein